MSIPVQTAIAPVRISVLPKLSSIWMPRPTVTRPANSKPMPAINTTIIIGITLRLRPKCSQAAKATIPSYCAHRQRTNDGAVPMKNPSADARTGPKHQ